eukprot:gene23972-30258_t
MVSKSTPQKLDLTERMDKYEEFKNRRREEALRIKSEQEIQGVTFKPAIKLTKRSSTPTKTSVYERLSLVDRDREVSASQAEMESQMTFKPQLVSRRSASPGPKSTSGGEYKDVHERLFKEGQLRKKDLEMERQLIMEENESHLTFKPMINPRSAHKGDSAEGNRESGPVFERLATTSSRQYMQEVLSKIKTDLEMKDCTFKPKLLTAESSRSHPKDGGAEPIFVRLAQEGERVKADTQRKQELKISEELSQATFSPQIPVRSSSIAKRRSSVASSVDGGGSEDNIYLRLHTTPKTPVAAPDPTVAVTGTLSLSEQKEKVVMPKQDLDKVFRRLSMATTESLGSLTQRDDESVTSKNPPSGSVTSAALVLPEKKVEQIFNNLSMKRTASFSMRMLQVQEDAAPTKSPIKGIKTVPEENLEKMFQRLSQPTGSTLDLNETLQAETTRRASVSSSSASPMNRTLSSSKLLSPTAASSARYLVPHASSHQLTTHFEAPLPSPVQSKAKQVAVNPPAPPPPPPVANKAHVSAPVAMSTPKPAAPPAAHSAPKPVVVTPVQQPAPKAKAAAPAGNDFFSKLEASLSLMESMKFDTPPPAAISKAPVAVATPPPESSVDAEERSAPVQVVLTSQHTPPPHTQQPQHQQQHQQKPAAASSSSPRNGTNGGRGAAASNKSPKGGAKKAVPAPVAAANGGPKVLKGKKKSSEVMEVDEQQKQLELQQQQQSAEEFIENIPFITTEGSDSEEEDA